MLMLGAVFVLSVIVFLYLRQTQKENDGEPVMNYQLTPITSATTMEGHSSWSPDGSMFAYTSLQTGNADIFIRNKYEGDPIQLVSTPFDEYNPRWSPDGSKVAYSSVREDGTNIYWVPSTGGLERKIAGTNVPGVEQGLWPFYLLGAAPWSSDGERLLFSKMLDDGSVAIFQANIKNGREEQMTSPHPGGVDHSASWSHDGNSIVFPRNGKLWTKIKSNQGEKLLLNDKTILARVFSQDDKKVIFSMIEPTGVNIWEFALSKMELKQLTSSTKWMFNPVVLPNGSLSVDQFSHQVDLMRFNTETKEHEQLTDHNSSNFYARLSKDGDRILYESNRTGNFEIWSINLNEGKREINLTNNPAADSRADESPNGKEIAFFSDRDSAYKVWIMDNTGQHLRKASNESVHMVDMIGGYVHQMKWSPDGKKIGYLALSEGGIALWILDLETGLSEPRLINVNSFDWYLTSEMVICNQKVVGNTNATDLVVINLKSGEETILKKKLPLTELFCSADGKRVGYTSALGHYTYNLFQLKLNPPAASEGFPTLAGEPEQLTFGNGKWHVHSGCFSSDGKWIIYSRDADQSDIFLIENYK